MHARLLVRRTRRQQHQDGKQERAIYRTARPRRESQPFRPFCPRCAHSNTRCHLRDMNTRALCVSAGRHRHRCVLCSAQTCSLELGTHHSPAATAAAPRSMVRPSGICPPNTCFLYDATRANCRAIGQASPPVRPGSAAGKARVEVGTRRIGLSAGCEGSW